MDDSTAETFDEATAEGFPPEVDASTIVVIHPGAHFVKVCLHEQRNRAVRHRSELTLSLLRDAIFLKKGCPGRDGE
jgi:hypothetical protein